MLKTDITKCSEAGEESWCKSWRFHTVLGFTVDMCHLLKGRKGEEKAAVNKKLHKG